MKKKMALFLLVSLMTGIAAHADVPRTINYQGRLTDLNGYPLPDDATYAVTLRLYTSDNAPESASVWSDNYSVQTKNGYFNLVIGSSPSFPLNLDFDQQYYLGVKVGTDTEMTPRQPLNSVPYALNVADNAITTGKLAAGAVDNSKIKNNAVTKIYFQRPADLNVTYAGDFTICSQSVTADFDGTINIFFKGFVDPVNVTTDIHQGARICIDSIEKDATRVGINPTSRFRCAYSLMHSESISANTTKVVTIGTFTGGGQTGFPVVHSGLALLIEVIYK